MATMRDIARQAQVSVSTVSAVINKKPCVADPLRHHVEGVIAALGYARNPHATNLKSRTSNTIAILIPNITSIFFPEILKGIERGAKENGMSILICDTNKSIEDEKEYMRIMKNYWVKGIVLDTLADLESDHEYRRFICEDLIERNGTAIVLMESTSSDRRLASVSVDNVKGGYDCTNHLLRMGHRRIAHITGNPHLRFSQLRTQGYRNALHEYGIVFEPALIADGDFSPLSGYTATKRLLQEGGRFSALFAANDQMLVGAIKAFKEHGLRVPEDVAAAGFDNTFVATLVDPALTTINVPRFRMGHEAARLVREHNRPDCSNNVVLEGNLIVRRSSDPAASGTWDLYGW
jgi:DNA-binding LacI/PurR family transcriptional regulator